MSDQFSRINGSTFRYRELNKGLSRPLVMFNGTALNYECWKPLSTRLKRHMILLDLPGCGGSSLYDRPPSMDRYVDDMIFLLYGLLEKDQEMQPFDLAGFSFGGVLAQAITEKYPDTVNKLVLLSTTPGFSGQIPSYKAIMMSLTFGRAIWANLFGLGSPDGDIVRNFKPPNLLGPVYSTGALTAWSKKDRKVNEEHEALIIHGSKDTLLPVRNALALNQLFKGSTLDIVSGGDHLTPLTHAEYCSERINAFLS
jgi:pimeloyl-ACP methyl ester carboxylesterase